VNIVFLVERQGWNVTTGSPAAPLLEDCADVCVGSGCQPTSGHAKDMIHMQPVKGLTLDGPCALRDSSSGWGMVCILVEQRREERTYFRS